MSENKSNTSSGIGFTGLLTIVFITLKLLNVITWSWLWVLSPIWISILLVIVMLIVIVLVVSFSHTMKSFCNRKKYGKR